MSLESSAIFWLRFRKNCFLVLTERSPMRHGGIPDVLGITKARYCIEVECKRTMSDFRANANKHCVRNRDVWIDRWPKQFFFCVPESMLTRALEELPEYAGLLSLRDGWRLNVEKEAPVNYKSKRLDLKQCLHAVQLLTNQLHFGTGKVHHEWAARELAENDYVI